MADDLDLDVPPLEDMTQVLKQADAVRQGRLATSFDDKPATKVTEAKQRAKVKKNVAARSVRPENLGDGDGTNTSKPTSTPLAEKKTNTQSTTDIDVQPASSTTAVSKPKSTTSTSGGMFGGLKKGFLFGGPAKPFGSTNSTQASKPKTAEPPKISSHVQKELKEVKSVTEDIPYISPSTGKTDSGLTMIEVQQAMSEAKGLLEGDEWVTDDLLNKVEKNDLLLKRFADPQFMKALQEFQTNPEAAMEKYKGNKEVEKFLLEFCGLLGDHFTHMGNKSDGAATSSATTTKPAKSSKTTPKVTEESKSQKPKPKIIEIQDSQENATSNITEDDHSSNRSTEISSSLPSSMPSDKITLLNTPQNLSDLEKKGPVIQTRNPNLQADIQELPQTQDAEVKEVLNDPKVMEILLDPKVMNLIETLRENPVKAQRLVDEADRDLKEKIGFLVSRGLLQFQS